MIKNKYSSSAMMDSESSNDVIAFESNETLQDNVEGKPIMKLFRCLLSNDNKQNTVLTNAQILEILNEEFNISTKKLHKLEVEIYMHIVKKFLKEWPKWDEIDPIMNRLRENDDTAVIDKYLHTKYDELKKYLNGMLEIARPRAKEMVKEVEQKFKEKNPNPPVSQLEKESETSDVKLEICCTRAQLNNLFYRVPNPEQNYTIFNAAATEPTRITLDQPEHEAMLNWWNINIIIKLSCIQFVRSTTHESKLKLVNKKLNYEKSDVEKLQPYFQKKNSTLTKIITVTGTSLYKKNYTMNLPLLIKQITGCLQVMINCDKVLLTLFNLILKDLEDFPSEYLEEAIWYRKYFSKYPYVRYLYKDLESNDDTAKKYDLHLEEVIDPMYQYHVAKVDTSMLNFNAIKSDVMSLGSRAVQLECKACNLKFGGASMLEQLKQHIWENHFDEPDWQCMKCMKTYSMVHLANNHWKHECDNEDDMEDMND